MKWLRSLCLIVILAVIILPIGVASADLSSNIDVSVYATPFTGGITSFTITYITDTDMRLDWTTDGAVGGVMIRAQYGRYPNDIPNTHTAPSDGYLVYSGNGTTIHDTSMNFDENPGGLYYAIWAQHLDGTWFTSKLTGWKESIEMVLLFFLIFSLGLTYISSRYSYYPLRFFAGASWFGIMAYWIANRPTNITAGSATDVIIIVLLIGIAVAVMFMSSWFTKTENGRERGGFDVRVPRFLGGKSEDEEAEIARRNAITWRERRSQYQDRLNNAINGRR